MQVAFTEPASIELDDAIEYYSLRLNEVGKLFLDEVLETIDLIRQFPQIWPQNSGHTRKAILRHFPYNLIYSIMNDRIVVIAIAHQNREPEYWIDRLAP